jgi:SNF2 family DNA or RNA helicase
LVDARLIWWDAYIPRGKVNQARAPLYMILYCHDPNVAIIERYFKNNRFYLRDPPFWHPDTQYTNINPYLQNPGALKPDAYMNQYYSKYEMENGSQMKNDIQKLLDSIPSSVPKKKQKKKHKETEDGKIILDSDDDDESEQDDEEEDIYIEGLRMDLMPHQHQGVKWMVDRENNQSSGGILADVSVLCAVLLYHIFVYTHLLFIFYLHI